MLEAVGLGERTGHKPKQLSGGQKQRVAIARGLVHQPRLVLADEPTAALDEASGRQVVELLKKMAKEQQVTIVIVTHDNRILDVADRIVNLVDGSIRSDVLVQETAIVSQMLIKCDVCASVATRIGRNGRPPAVWKPSGSPDSDSRREAGDKFYLIRTGRVSVQRLTQSQPLAILKEEIFLAKWPC
ncbi:MAG: ATP-binding cassette domain-containing protein [Pirellulaceae bacterium]